MNMFTVGIARNSGKWIIAAFYFMVSVFCTTDLRAQQTTYTGLDTLQLRTIFHEPMLPGVRPSISGYSPIGNHLHFTWNDSSYQNTGPYRVDLSGQLVEPLEEEAAILARAVVAPNRSAIAFIENNSLIVANMDGSGRRTLFSSGNLSGRPVWSSNSRKIAFSRDGDVWSMHLENAEVRQHAQKKEGEPSYMVRAWGLNNRYLILQQTDTSHYKEIFFPEYVPEFVKPGGSMRGQPHITIKSLDLQSRDGDDAFRELFSGDAYVLNADMSADGQFFLLDTTDHAMKERSVKLYNLAERTELTVFSEITDGWIYPPLMMAGFSPEGNTLYFTSEESGFNQIYTARGDGSRLTRLTSGGDAEVDWVRWSGANTLVFSSTSRDPGLRDLFTININTRSTTRLTNTEAYRYDFRLSPDRRYISYMRTTWNEPADIFLLDIRRPDREQRLTQSIPERFKEIDWQKPEYIRFTGRDGETRISMDVLKPHNFVEGRQYPVVVFVHGAGSLQNVFQGWSVSYAREYMFHQLLNREGFVVVEVDYRHSTGYGRKFREDVTNWMGRFELEDIADGLRYLDENRGYLDMSKVGIYGGSYGGFMALYALSHKPEMFHAGAALRAVTDWRNYFHANPGYTRPRLGDPIENPVHYERSSPITFADSLSRPAIILHGLIDDNVGFQDAAQYIDRLIRSGNTNFETMFYPSERHGYVLPESWYDQYYRILRFFRTHLIPGDE
ncbi:MAG: prolyl oligopeptidase family serine peptidase [Balneolales bacterium]|nr:prolyl oligopeptidase family serine peptidase [Balneolales bacterium]